MRNHLQGLFAFATILTACLGGALHASSWMAVASACVLALISASNHSVATRMLKGSGEQIGTILVVSTAANAGVTVLAAFATGQAIGWLWGI